MDGPLRSMRGFMRGPPPSDNPYDSELSLGRPSLMARAGQIRPVRSMKNFVKARTSSESLNSSISSTEKQNLRKRASHGIIKPLGELLQRPFSRGPLDNPTPPPSRGEDDIGPHDGQYPPPPYLRPTDPDSPRLDVRGEFRKTPKEDSRLAVRQKKNFVQQRLEECATQAQFTPAHFESWVQYLQYLSRGCFNVNHLPEEPPMSESFAFLPALFPHKELHRQSVADALCSMIHNTAQRVEAERLLELTRTAFDTEAYTVSTFTESTEHWHFSSGTHQWPSGEKDRSKSLAAHALLSVDLLIVLNAQRDWRFQKHPLTIGGPKMRFFVAAPMLAPTGEVVAVVTFYSRFARERFELKNIRTLRHCSESLTSTLWLQDEKEEAVPAPMGTQNGLEVLLMPTPSRPFSGSDLTSVHHKPGHCTPERRTSSRPDKAPISRKLTHKANKNARKSTKRFDNAPDSPTLGPQRPVIHGPERSPKSPSISDFPDLDDITDVGNFQSAHVVPDQVRVRRYPFPPIISWMKASQICSFQLEYTLRLCKEALNFDSLYVVAMEPIRVGLPDAELEAGAMTMRMVASTGLGRDKQLSIAMHLAALRSPRDIQIMDTPTMEYYARGFAIPVLSNLEEIVDRATEGIVFGGFRRFPKGTYDLMKVDSMGFTHEEFRKLHSLRGIIVRTMMLEDQFIDGRPSRAHEDSSLPSAFSSMPPKLGIPTVSPRLSPSRYLANEAKEVEVPESLSKPPSSSRMDNSHQEGPQLAQRRRSRYAHLTPVGVRTMPFSRRSPTSGRLSPSVPQSMQKTPVSSLVSEHIHQSQGPPLIDISSIPGLNGMGLKGLNGHGLRREARSVRPLSMTNHTSPLVDDSSPEARSSDSEY